MIESYALQGRRGFGGLQDTRREYARAVAIVRHVCAFVQATEERGGNNREPGRASDERAEEPTLSSTSNDF